MFTKAAPTSSPRDGISTILPIPELWHPAIGALALGIIGFFVPRVLSASGYDACWGTF